VSEPTGTPRVLKPPRAERIAIAGPAGDLEALLETPAADEAAAGGPRAFAVVCHPHPVHGGTLDNKVVYTLARAFGQLGAAAIRFNFRGVGASAGRYDHGRGETEDALAVIAFGRRHRPGAALWLGGFSFGAAVAARIAAQAQAARVVLVAPGITVIDVDRATAPACPWLIVQGDADDVVPPQAVLAWARSLVPGPGVPAPEVRLLAGAGHYFHGRLNDLRETVLEFMSPPTAG
jgi:uncharacterized protein